MKSCFGLLGYSYKSVKDFAKIIRLVKIPICIFYSNNISQSSSCLQGFISRQLYPNVKYKAVTVITDIHLTLIRDKRTPAHMID